MIGFKKGHFFGADLKGNPMEKPIMCSDPQAVGTPKTPPSPAIGFDDPPKSTNAGAPSLPDSPAEEAAESPAYEKKERDTGIY